MFDVTGSHKVISLDIKKTLDIYCPLADWIHLVDLLPFDKGNNFVNFYFPSFSPTLLKIGLF